MAELTDPRLRPGAYITSDGVLWRVVRVLDGQALLENSLTLDMLEVDATAVIRFATLVRAAPDPLAAPQAP